MERLSWPVLGEDEGRNLQLHGESSTGKSLLGRACQSGFARARKNDVATYQSCGPGLDQLCFARNDLVMVLDEEGTAEGNRQKRRRRHSQNRIHGPGDAGGSIVRIIGENGKMVEPECVFSRSLRVKVRWKISDRKNVRASGPANFLNYSRSHLTAKAKGVPSGAERQDRRSVVDLRFLAADRDPARSVSDRSAGRLHRTESHLRRLWARVVSLRFAGINHVPPKISHGCWAHELGI